MRVLLFVIALLLAAENRVTMRIPLDPGEEVAVVTFDANRVSKQDVESWMKLSDSAYYSSPHTEASPDECKPDDIKKVEQEVANNRRILEDLDRTKYPPELSEVVTYLNRLQALWLWQAEQRVAFLQTGAIPQQYDGLHLSCDAAADRVRNARSQADACHAFNYDWENCVNAAVQKQLGTYPKQQWKAFLDAYSIQERVESSVAD